MPCKGVLLTVCTLTITNMAKIRISETVSGKFKHIQNLMLKNATDLIKIKWIINNSTIQHVRDENPRQQDYSFGGCSDLLVYTVLVRCWNVMRHLTCSYTHTLTHTTHTRVPLRTKYEWTLESTHEQVLIPGSRNCSTCFRLSTTSSNRLQWDYVGNCISFSLFPVT